MPWAVDQARQVWAPLVHKLSAGHHLVEVGRAVSEIVVVAVDTALRQPARPGRRESSPAPHRHVSPVSLFDLLARAPRCARVSLVGALDGEDDAELRAPSAASPGAGAPRRCRERRAFTGVSKRELWEQSGKSSGTAGLADKMPSTSPRGRNHARRTWGAARPGRSRRVGQLASAVSSVASRRRRSSRSARSRGHQGPLLVVSGSWRPVAPMRWGWPGGSKECYAEGENWLSGHGAHGSGRRCHAGARIERE